METDIDGYEVEMRVPADSSFVAMLRRTTAGMAARIDFTVDEIEDLRIAVDEACAILLPQARDGAGLSCRYRLTADRLTVQVWTHSDHPVEPRRDGFAWTVLTALAGDVDAGTGDDGKVCVTLDKRPETLSGS